MSDPVEIPAAEIRQCLDEESLRTWVQEQRWYASKSRAVSGNFGALQRSGKVASSRHGAGSAALPARAHASNRRSR